jgi:hypothetical protein
MKPEECQRKETMGDWINVNGIMFKLRPMLKAIWPGNVNFVRLEFVCNMDFRSVPSV